VKPGKEGNGDRQVKHSVYLVRGQDGSCFGWLVDAPLAGCHVRGEDCESVVEALPREIEVFLDVLSKGWASFEPGVYLPVKIDVTAELKRRGSATDGSSHLFPEERSAPSRDEVSERLQVLACTRMELLAAAERLPVARLDWQEPGKPRTHTVLNQLRHIADVERWYLGRLWRNLPRLERSESVWQRLELTRRLVEEWFTELPDKELARVERYNGELWSARKILRRLVYHEWFHLKVVRRITKKFMAEA
jgi:uncharacterized damage-inducible protein DinB